MKYLGTLLLVLAAVNLVHAQKKPLDHTVYDGWQSIAERIISNNGKFAAYTINPQEGDGVLVIQQTNGQKLLEVPRGYAAAFAGNSSFIVLKIKPAFKDSRDAKVKKKKADEMPKDSFAIVNLATLAIEKFPKTLGYKLPKDNPVWVAWQQEAAKKTTDKKDDKKEADKKEDKKEDGYTLYWRNLVSGVTDSLLNITDYTTDATGTSLLAEYAGSKKDSLLPAVILVQAATGKRDTIMQGFYDAKAYAFDETGRQLAFVAERDSANKEAQKFYKLWYYKQGADSAVLLADKTYAGIPANWSISDNATLKFSKSGNRLQIGTAPILPPKDTSLPEFERVNVDVWHYQDDQLQTAQLKNLDRELKKSYLALYDLTTNKLQQLGNETFERVYTTQEGDGSVFYTSTDTGRRIAVQWQGYSFDDVYAINPATGERTLIIKNFKGTAYPSYTGKYLLLYDEIKRKYFAYNSTTRILQPVATDIPYPLYDEDNDVPDYPNNYGIVSKWLENDAAVLIYDRYDVWKVDPSGKIKSQLLTQGRATKDEYRYLSLNDDEEYIPATQKLYYRIYNHQTKTSRLSTVFAGTLTYKDNNPVPVKTVEKVAVSNIIKAKDAEVFLFSQETYRQSPDIYSSARIDTFSLDEGRSTTQTFYVRPVKLSGINEQQQNYLWGTAELFTWKPYSGKPAEGILYKPEDFDSTKKYPMIVYFYERNNQTLYNYIAPAPTPSRLNISFFVSRGYVVFVPDIWYTTGHPGKSAYNYIVSGTRALIKKGFVDSIRIGLQGQSWGGYQTAYLITQTPLYKAAWAGAPVSNMFSAYGGIRWESGMNRQFQYEHTQSRIGATIWDKPELYIENSPLFHLKKVTTPLVIMANDNDGAVPWYQGIEMFTAMRRLGKPVWMLNYNNEAHNLIERRNRKDIQIREQQFFDWLLKGEQPAPWIKQGVPAILKGRSLGL